MSDPVKVRIFTLVGPDRVVIDIPEALWRAKAADRPSGRGAIKEYRYGSFRPGESRFVIDLDHPVSVGDPLILPPRNGHGYRIVVDLLASSQEAFERSSGWPDDLRSKDPVAARAGAAAGLAVAAEREKRIIVIDAGHGGIDSGTRGYNGEMEKDLVLDEALRLGRMLGQRGYAVHLTRNEDVYVPLRERVDSARAFRADLFVSLHADSNPDPKVFGASVYTLSAASSDAEAAALARKENQSDVIAGVDLGGENSPVASILIGLAQRDTINRSVRFADTLVTSLERATDILPRAPHRSAGFVVLKALDVPAVLVELGYLSNPADCARMASDAWRDKIARAIADAVDQQFRRNGPGEQLSTEAAK
jgi:N-acetylmuramoyl-L-alanine amidase